MSIRCGPGNPNLLGHREFESVFLHLLSNACPTRLPLDLGVGDMEFAGVFFVCRLRKGNLHPNPKL